nr:MAG TPA: hypothetical protein [Caudoviricetes sp.]
MAAGVFLLPGGGRRGAGEKLLTAWGEIEKKLG